MIKLVEVCQLLNASNSARQKYTLREVFINPKHIVALREDDTYAKKLKEGVLPDGLHSKQRFTRLTLNRGQTGLEVIVVGIPSLIESKLNGGRKKNVLKG